MSKQGTLEKFVQTLQEPAIILWYNLCEYEKSLVANITMSIKLLLMYLGLTNSYKAVHLIISFRSC